MEKEKLTHSLLQKVRSRSAYGEFDPHVSQKFNQNSHLSDHLLLKLEHWWLLLVTTASIYRYLNCYSVLLNYPECVCWTVSAYFFKGNIQ